MPLYEYFCGQHMFTVFRTVANFQHYLPCECGALGEVQISAPLLVKAAPDVSYDSPIDGRPITSMAAREEDLKRSGCVPYDPAQKQDYDRRVRADEAALDQAVEATVEEAVTKMDGDGRRRLASELLEQGVTAEAVRTTHHG